MKNKIKYSIALILCLFIRININAQDALTAIVTHATEPYCDDGAINLTVNGGYSPYTFEWTYDDGSGPNFYSSTEDLDQLRNYTYCVTVTDELCGTVSQCWVVNCCPIVPTETITPYCNSENMGSIKLDLSGGYNYYVSWFDSDGNSLSGSDSGIDNLEPGQYTAVFQSQECSFTRNYLVPDNNLSYSTISFDNPDCYFSKDNGIIQINVQSNTSATIMWYHSNNGYPDGGSIGTGDILDNLAEGEYIAVIENGGCTIMTREYRLICCTEFDSEGQPYNALPKPDFTSLSSTWVSATGVCDGSISFTTNQSNQSTTVVTTVKMPGNIPIYSLNNLCEGQYCLTIDNGCDTYTKCIELKSCSSVNIQISGQITNTCSGVAFGRIGVTASGGEAPYKFSWSNGKTTSSIDKLSVGQYCLTVTDVHGCKGISCFTVGLNAFTFQDQTIPCGTNKLCNGEFVSFTPFDGNLNVTFSGCRTRTTRCPVTGGIMSEDLLPFLGFRIKVSNCTREGLCPVSGFWETESFGNIQTTNELLLIPSCGCLGCFAVTRCFINGQVFIMSVVRIGINSCDPPGIINDDQGEFSMRSIFKQLSRDTTFMGKDDVFLFPDGIKLDILSNEYNRTIDSLSKINDGYVEVNPISKDQIDIELSCETSCKKVDLTESRRSISELYVTISPNPFSEITSLKIKSDSKSQLLISIRDIYGNKIQSFNTFIEEGENSIQLDCTQWIPGLYFISIENIDKSFSNIYKIIKT